MREVLSEHGSGNFEIVHFTRIAPASTFFDRDMVDVPLLDYQLPDSVDLNGLTRITAAAAKILLIGNTFNDWAHQTPLAVEITRVGGPPRALPRAPLGRAPRPAIPVSG